MFSALVSLLLFAGRYVSAAKCHPDDESGLLAFKSGITEDPSGFMSNWEPGTDCCHWSRLECAEGSNNRVTTMGFFGDLDDPDKYLSGTFSPLLSKVQNLEGIYFQDLRNLTGPFPKFLFNLPKLTNVHIENSKLSGPLPIDIGRLSHLKVLSLTGNRFSGPIASSISNLTNLDELRLGNNLLSGPIPNGLRQLKVVCNISCSRTTNLSGGIPTSFASLAPTMMYLELGNNRLSGKIPDFISNFKSLKTLDLSSNGFFGVLPKSFKKLTEITNLNLARNKLVDPFPDLAIRTISYLDLSYNKFKLGDIPKWATSSEILYSIKLAGCGIKMRLDDLKSLGNDFYNIVDFSDNEISGSPVNLVNNKGSLVGFSASRNQLKFNLSDLELPRSMKYLDLSRNQVFGSVPESIVGLEKLNLSYNRLCGKIPASKFPASAFEGNACLCGSPLPACRRQ
ncbi:hypothetical protein Syun_005790 [Stephania yunnanensis]|uniref:Leucine-rich repeat-containing N-terminal plant-type domain-containing protein n=1 Tax=Stephania yunnanensis TaxID=152371 RepID=A0AAP0KYT3_9MAGN